MNMRIWLLLCSSLTVLAGATLSPSLPAMTEVFSDAPYAQFWVKCVVTAPGLAVVFSAFLFGGILDKYSKFKTLYFCLFAYGVLGCAGYFFDDNLILIVCSRALMGFSVAGIMVAVTTIAMGMYSGNDFNKYMGMQAAFGSFSAVIFISVSGLLSELNWAYPFLLHAIALLLLLLVVYPKVSIGSSKFDEQMAVNKPKATSTATSEAGESNKHREDLANEFPKIHILSLFVFLGFCELLLLYVIPLFMPFYFLTNFGFTASVTGGILGGIFCVLAVASLIYSKLAQKMSFLQVHLMGYACIFLGYIGLALTTLPLMIGVALLLLSFGFGVIRPNLIVWLFSLCNPAVRGRVMGLVTSGFFLGQFASPIVFSIWDIQQGLVMVFSASAIIAIFVGASAYLLHFFLTKSPGETPKYFLNAKEKLET